MGKGTHFFGQPIYGQLIKCLDKAKILEMSREMGGERYVKRFDAWHHLLTMFYAVIMRFDSLREIEPSMLAEVRKLAHLGLETVPRRSTLSDANARRPEKFFEAVYRDLYERYKDVLSSDSRRNAVEAWMKKLRIIDSTTISLFSNLLFKGVGRHPKTGKKKGGLKVHSVIHANEGVPCDVRFTSAATNDSIILVPSYFSAGEILAMDRAYINYEKMEELTVRGVVYVTKMKRQIESLFKQIKQSSALPLRSSKNFPLRYFYGESANAIKIQIWVTLIANLLLTLLQRRLTRPWSFSGLATMVRIVLMYYINLETFFERPEEDMKLLLLEAAEPPPNQGKEQEEGLYKD